MHVKWIDKQGYGIEGYMNQPIKNFIRLLFQIIRGNARIKIIKSYYPDKIFASTGAEEMNKVNVKIGVTAHCRCGHIFCDDIYAGLKTELPNK